MVGSTDVRRGDVYWVNLDPTIGSEVRKVRPALIISPDDLNANLPRVIIAPLTTKGLDLPCRPIVRLNNKRGKILLDQLRSVDKRRLRDRMGSIDLERWHPILMEMLA